MSVVLHSESFLNTSTFEKIEYTKFNFSAGEIQVRLPDLERVRRIIISCSYPTTEDLVQITLLLNAIKNSKV